MVLDDYSNMSIDELGSSLLQKKADDERRAAKKSRKNERVQKALGVLLMGQGLMKNQYTKRVKELEDMHKFEIMDNETYLKELSNLLKPLSPDLGMLLKNTMKNIKMKIVNL